MKDGAFRDSISLLFTRRFGVFCFASLLSNLGTWAQNVAQPWLLLSLGASPFLLGLDSFALGAPVWLLTLAGGVLADRADKRRVISICQSIQMLCPVSLVLLLWTGAVAPWMVILLSLAVGITDALSMPSFQTIVPCIVEREQVASAYALNATQFNLSRILGPALAGVLMVSAGAMACFALNALSYAPFILVALWILPKRAGGSASGADADAGAPFSGFREIALDPDLRGCLATVLCAGFFCGPLVTFCPVLVTEAFQGDVSHFSATMGAFGVGGLVGAIGLLGVDARRDRRRFGLCFALFQGVVVALAALNPWLWGLPALLALAGLGMTVCNTSMYAYLQTAAPDRLRGQAASLFMLSVRGGVSAGSLLTGAAANMFGVRPALMIDGCLAVAAAGAIGAAWLMQRRGPPGEARRP